MARPQWSSRAAFVVSAIGAAIGFGNVWRFPTLAYRYGGGAFFIPYLLALLFIGIPILILEVAIGQYYQTGDAGAFGRVNKRFRGVGLNSVICSFVVTLYYCVLLAWVLRMFVYSFQGADGRWSNVSGEDAINWFNNVVTGLGTANGKNNDIPTRLVGPNVGSLAIVWLFIFLCLAFGVKWTGRIAYFTVGLPILFLFVLLIRAVTLDGAGDGIKAYIGEWDLGVLSKEPAVWSEAVTQVFFSVSITFGIMTAYASYMKRDSPVFTNSIIIALANSMYSIIAGFAVFGTVGYIANREGKTISELEGLGGPSLVFATYPLALSTLPGSGHWERLLFVALFLLGIDSAFSLVEAPVTVLSDTRLLRNVPRLFSVGVVCLAGFLGGLLYCSDTGLLFLDVTDFYVNFMMLLVGILETFSVGWVYGIQGQIDILGRMPVFGYMLATYAPVFLASGFWFGAESDALMKGFVSLSVSYVVLMVLVMVLVSRVVNGKEKESPLSWKSALIELFFGNILRLRRDLTAVVKYIPLAWFFLIRHVIPPLLIVLFANLASAKNSAGDSKFGHYSGYPTGYQALGITVFSISLSILLFGAIFPDAYSCFDIVEIDDEKEQEESIVKTVDRNSEEDAEMDVRGIEQKV